MLWSAYARIAKCSCEDDLCTLSRPHGASISGGRDVMGELEAVQLFVLGAILSSRQDWCWGNGGRGGGKWRRTSSSCGMRRGCGARNSGSATIGARLPLFDHWRRLLRKPQGDAQRYPRSPSLLVIGRVHSEQGSASSLKGKSAIHIARTYLGRRQNFTEQHSWARGYYVSTVGKNEAAIREYIRRQQTEDQRLDQLEMLGG